MNATTSTGQRFFCSVPNGVFNLCSSFTDVKEFGRLVQVRQSSKLSNAHWERNLHQYAHRTDPQFNVFESKEALRWVLLVRNIHVRGWELRLRYPSGTAVKARYLSHIDNFHAVCKDGELDIVKAMVERTQVDLEARGRYDRTHCTWQHARVSSLGCTICVSRGLARRRGMRVIRHHYTRQHIMVTSVWSSIFRKQGADKEAEQAQEAMSLSTKCGL